MMHEALTVLSPLPGLAHATKGPCSHARNVWLLIYVHRRPWIGTPKLKSTEDLLITLYTAIREVPSNNKSPCFSMTQPSHAGSPASHCIVFHLYYPACMKQLPCTQQADWQIFMIAQLIYLRVSRKKRRESKALDHYLRARQQYSGDPATML